MKTARSVVYFMREVKPQAPEAELIKIGFTKDVDVRHAVLQTQYNTTLRLLAIIPGGREQEQKFHKMFSFARIHPDREWFRQCPELDAVITALPPAPPPRPLTRLSLELSELDRDRLIALKAELQKQRRTLKEFVLEAIWEKAAREHGKRK